MRGRERKCEKRVRSEDKEDEDEDEGCALYLGRMIAAAEGKVRVSSGKIKLRFLCDFVGRQKYVEKKSHCTPNSLSGEFCRRG